jgi:hypothetical protein
MKEIRRKDDKEGGSKGKKRQVTIYTDRQTGRRKKSMKQQKTMIE